MSRLPINISLSPYLMIKYKAPATLMIMGEHAILHGHPAIAASIDQYITTSLIPREDEQITLQSELGDYQATLSNLPADSTFTFVIEAIRAFIPNLKRGFDLMIESDFSSKIGFGSSAAVLSSTLSCLKHFTKTNQNLIEIGQQIIQKIQTYGSGMDLITSLTGGIIYYDPSTKNIKKIADHLPLHAIYSGYKTPTATVLKMLFGKPHDNIYEEIGTYAQEAKQAIERKDHHALGILFDHAQDAFKALDLTCEKTNKAITYFKKHPSIYGAKISGSGLGDCIIGIGNIEPALITQIKPPHLYIPLKIESQGCHEIT